MLKPPPAILGVWVGVGVSDTRDLARLMAPLFLKPTPRLLLGLGLSRRRRAANRTPNGPIKPPLSSKSREVLLLLVPTGVDGRDTMGTPGRQPKSCPRPGRLVLSSKIRSHVCIFSLHPLRTRTLLGLRVRRGLVIMPMFITPSGISLMIKPFGESGSHWLRTGDGWSCRPAIV